MADNLNQSVRMAEYQLTSQKFLAPREYQHLVRVLRKLPVSHRDRLIIQLGLETGARPSELLGIRKTDLFKSSKSVLIRGLKGSSDREIPLKPALFAYLKRHAEKSETELVFDIGYHRLRQIWDWYRPCAKSLHSMRHTFAIRLYQKSKDLRLVQFALGHRSISNTMIYARYNYSQSELRRVLLGQSVSKPDDSTDFWNLD